MGCKRFFLFHGLFTERLKIQDAFLIISFWLIFCWLADVSAQVNESALQSAHMEWVLSSSSMHVSWKRCRPPEPLAQQAAVEQKLEERKRLGFQGKLTHICHYWHNPQQPDVCERLAGNATTSWPVPRLPASSAVILRSLSRVSLSRSELARLFTTCWWEVSAPLAVDRAHVQTVWLERRCLRRGLSCQDASSDAEDRWLSAVVSERGAGRQIISLCTDLKIFS